MMMRKKLDEIWYKVAEVSDSTEPMVTTVDYGKEGGTGQMLIYIDGLRYRVTVERIGDE